MECPNCGAEMLITRQVDGKYWYVCVNRRCPNFRMETDGENKEQSSIKTIKTPKETQ